jgi:hypothetical protein
MDSSQYAVTDMAAKKPIDHQKSDLALRELRRNLNRLRREARKLDQAAIEDCLTLAITLTSARSSVN